MYTAGVRVGLLRSHLGRHLGRPRRRSETGPTRLAIGSSPPPRTSDPSQRLERERKLPAREPGNGLVTPAGPVSARNPRNAHGTEAGSSTGLRRAGGQGAITWPCMLNMLQFNPTDVIRSARARRCFTAALCSSHDAARCIIQLRRSSICTTRFLDSAVCLQRMPICITCTPVPTSPGIPRPRHACSSACESGAPGRSTSPGIGRPCMLARKPANGSSTVCLPVHENQPTCASDDGRHVLGRGRKADEAPRGESCGFAAKSQVTARARPGTGRHFKITFSSRQLTLPAQIPPPDRLPAHEKRGPQQWVPQQCAVGPEPPIAHGRAGTRCD